MNGFIVLVAGGVGTDQKWQQAWLVGASSASQAQALVEAHPKLYAKPEVTFVGELTADHGGSIIALALRLAASKRNSLNHIQKWVTVGSPFIQMRRKFFPWSRLNILGQAVLSFSILALFIFAAGVTGQTFFADNIAMIGGGSVFILCLGGLHISDRRARLLYSHRSKERYTDQFQSRWCAVLSSHDEATTGLSRLPNIRVNIFESQIIGDRPLMTAIKFLVQISTATGRRFC